MSELMKMLNDDTTQILLAIVLGIIICWFIFGRNCGCSDGFSVGGPCEGIREEGGDICPSFRTQELCPRPDCRWTDPPPPAPPSPPCNALLVRAGQPGVCPDRDLQNPRLAHSELLAPELPPACCRALQDNPSENCNIATDSELNSTPDGRNLAKEIDWARIICDQSGEGDANAITGLSPPSGTQFNSLDEARLAFEAQAAPLLGRYAGTPEEAKGRNIVKSIKQTIKLFYDTDAGGDDFATHWGESAAPRQSRFNTFDTVSTRYFDQGQIGHQKLRGLANGKNLRFILLENSSGTTPEQQIKNYLFFNSMNIMGGRRTARRGGGSNWPVGNPFLPFSKLNTREQIEWYCKDLKINDRIDPIMKLRSAQMDSTQQPGDTCGDSDVVPFPSSQNYQYNLPGSGWLDDRPVNELIRDQLLEGLYPWGSQPIDQACRKVADVDTPVCTVIGPGGSQFIVDGFVFNQSTVEDKLLKGLETMPGEQGGPPQNAELLYVKGPSDRTTNLFSVPVNQYNSKLPSPIIFKHNSGQYSTEGDLLGNVIERNTEYTLININGLSEEGETLLERRSEAPYVFNGPVNTLSQNQSVYLHNLFWLQYYLFRMIIGGGNYLHVNAFAETVTNPGTTEPHLRVNNYVTNSECVGSGTDYILLTLLETPASAPSIPNAQFARDPTPWVNISSDGLYLNTIDESYGYTSQEHFNNIHDPRAGAPSSGQTPGPPSGQAPGPAPKVPGTHPVHTKGEINAECHVEHDECAGNLECYIDPQLTSEDVEQDRWGLKGTCQP